MVNLALRHTRIMFVTPVTTMAMRSSSPIANPTPQSEIRGKSTLAALVELAQMTGFQTQNPPLDFVLFRLYFDISLHYGCRERECEGGRVETLEGKRAAHSRLLACG